MDHARKISELPATLTKYGLVADIGGTNIRFGIVDLGAASGVRVLAPASFPVAGQAGVAEAAQTYLASQRVQARPSAAVLAIAGPRRMAATT
ncbi:MAG: glucokinase [Rhizomicrobium sp.]